MPRLHCYLILPVLAATLMASACGGDSGPSSAKASASTTTPAATAPAKVNITTQSINEDTDRYLIKLSYPQTSIAAADTQIKKIIDAAVADIKNATKDGPKGPPVSAAGKYTLDGSFTTILGGPDIISISLSISTYTGGAHGSHVIYGLNFDKTGKALTLDDALSMTRLTLAQLSDQLTQQLKTKLGRDFLFPDGVSADPKNFDTFLISADKITFVFQEYQVAPYVAGIQQLSVPVR
jgi:hypothetical protein